MSIAVLKPSRLESTNGHFRSSIGAKAIEWSTKSRLPKVSPAWSNTRATSSSFWTSQGMISLAPTGSASLRTRRSILSPGRWVKPTSAPSSRSFCVIAQAMLKSLATPSTSPFFPENNPISDPFRAPRPGSSSSSCSSTSSYWSCKITGRRSPLNIDFPPRTGSKEKSRRGFRSPESGEPAGHGTGTGRRTRPAPGSLPATARLDRAACAGSSCRARAWPGSRSLSGWSCGSGSTWNSARSTWTRSSLLKNLVGQGDLRFPHVLEQDQMAPPGFLVVERIMVRLPLESRRRGGSSRSSAGWPRSS